MKRFIIGLLVGVILGASTGVFASVGDRIEVVISKFVVKVDGVEQNIDADILNRNGNTYVPLRLFAKMLGKEVGYDDDTRTIELNTPASTSTFTNKEASDMPFIEFDMIRDSINPQIEAREEELAALEETKKALPHRAEWADEKMEVLRKEIAGLEEQKAALESGQ